MVDNEENKKNRSQTVAMTEDFTSGVWSEKDLVITQDMRLRAMFLCLKLVRKTEFFLIS